MIKGGGLKGSEESGNKDKDSKTSTRRPSLEGHPTTPEGFNSPKGLFEKFKADENSSSKSEKTIEPPVTSVKPPISNESVMVKVNKAEKKVARPRTAKVRGTKFRSTG